MLPYLASPQHTSRPALRCVYFEGSRGDAFLPGVELPELQMVLRKEPAGKSRDTAGSSTAKAGP